MGRPVLIIPARMDSSRLPGKPLIDIFGKTLLRRCYEEAQCSQMIAVSDIYITTPDREVVDEIVERWHGFSKKNIVWTSPNCRNGTERVAETVELLGLSEDTVVVNYQADQFGFRSRDFIDGPVLLVQSGTFQVATVVSPLWRGDCSNPQVVKAILKYSPAGEYISQFLRDVPASYSDQLYRHVGIYAATAGQFLEYANLPETKEERDQKLEQLRWQELIGAYFIQAPPVTIDTPEDIVVK